MNITWPMALKYWSWILTVGTAIVGSWLFEYTTTDKETGRKMLTVWGRRGVFFSGLALASSLALTLLTDHEAAQKQKGAENKAEQESKKVDENQRKVETALADLKSYAIATAKATSLSPQDKAAIGQTVVSLTGI